MPIKSCFNCGYRPLDITKCPLIGYVYPQSANSNPVCPYHTGQLTTCGNCGQIIPKTHYALIHSNDGNWKPICDKCLSLSGHCGGCSKSTTCDFETNPSPIPKAVQKQVRHGNQILMTTVKNEERIRETCKKNCGCFSKEFGCLRENGTCGNYEGAF